MSDIVNWLATGNVILIIILLRSLFISAVKEGYYEGSLKIRGVDISKVEGIGFIGAVKFICKD